MHEVTTIRTPTESALSELFHTVKGYLPGDPATRESAFAVVDARGLPHRRIEEWKYTDLRALMREAKPLATALDAQTIGAARPHLPLQDLDALRLTMLNGAYAPALSSPSPRERGEGRDEGQIAEGVSVTSFAKALSDGHPALRQLGSAGAPGDNPAIALNTAFAADGLIITVAKGTTLEQPLHVAFLQSGMEHAAYARVLVVVEEGASLTLIESHTGAGAHQTNAYVEILAADNTTLRHVKLQNEDTRTQHLATLAVRLGGGANFNSLALARGAGLARQQIFLSFQGEESEATLAGVTLASARRHLDTTLVVDHAMPHCNSRERFKAVLDGEARSVFQGKIIVRQAAQKTDGQMKTDTLMLSEGAEADLKPELEIFADDVVCAHGATCGALNDDLLFYLKARGIPQAEAEALMVQAFVGEVLDDVENEPLREALYAIALAWLNERD